MVEPSTKKEVQKLIGRIAALSRFISKSAERSLPFFKALRGGDKVEWGPEQPKDFQQLKNYLATRLMVTVPDLEAPLLLYIVASDHVVSGVLVQEKEEESKVIQQPVYYILEALSGAKLNYTEILKIAYEVLISLRKLKHYFQAHEITIPSSQPLGDILSNKEAYGRSGKWATELSQFELNYVSRTTIKSQALVDFVADWTPSVNQTLQPQPQIWTLHTDGAWGHLDAKASAILIAPSVWSVQI